MRKDLEIISEKTRYKILLTLFVSEQALSFSQLKKLLSSVEENKLNYHLKILRENNFIKNEKKKEYKRNELRSFYFLNKRAKHLLETLGLSNIKTEFKALFKKLT